MLIKQRQHLLESSTRPNDRGTGRWTISNALCCFIRYTIEGVLTGIQQIKHFADLNSMTWKLLELAVDEHGRGRDVRAENHRRPLGQKRILWVPQWAADSPLNWKLPRRLPSHSLSASSLPSLSSAVRSLIRRTWRRGNNSVWYGHVAQYGTTASQSEVSTTTRS